MARFFHISAFVFSYEFKCHCISSTSHRKLSYLFNNSATEGCLTLLDIKSFLKNMEK